MTADQTPPPPPRPARRSLLKIVVQVLGFLVSIGLLVWAAKTTLGKPGMDEKLPKLLETPVWILVSLVLLTGMTIAWSGLVFWIVLRPVRKLRGDDLIAINSVSTLMGFAPFKIGLVFRVLLHARKDRMPVLQIMGWFAATGIIVLLSLGGAFIGSWWRGSVDVWWWALALGVPLVGSFAALLGGRRLARSKSLRWTQSRAWTRNLAQALDMLGHPSAVFGGLAFRVLDIASHAGRFYLAAEAARLAGLVEEGLTPSQSIIAGSTYFLIQALSPAGTLGPREALTIVLLGSMSKQDFGIIVLAVTAADTAGSLVMGAWGLAHLRPLKYFVARGAVPSTDAPRADPDQPDRR